jgi:hypothetical protein
MLRLSFLALSLTISATVSAATTGAEKILLFGSSITVNQDTSLDVTETISVYANGEQFEHGLVRQLPTTYKTGQGTTQQPRYQVQQVLINGASTASHLEIKENHLDIHIGDPEKRLTPGIYTYTVQYHVENALTKSAEQTTLCWPITGNTWPIPIFKVEADLTLPSGAVIDHFQATAGREGAPNQGCITQQPYPNKLNITSKQALHPGNGLSVDVSWQKAAVKQP